MIVVVRFVALTVAVLFGATGCSRSASSSASTGSRSPGRPDAPPAAQSPQGSASSAAAQSGTVKGKVMSGTGAIVVLEPRTPDSDSVQTDLPIMDQAGLTFSPELLLVRTGRPVEFRNSDDTLHNVHVGNIDTREPAFNVAIPTGEKYTYTFQKDGFYHVSCDIHPAMSAEIFASSTPFATVAETDGSFSFAEVPPGLYTVRAFSNGGQWQREVEIRIGVNEVRIE